MITSVPGEASLSSGKMHGVVDKGWSVPDVADPKSAIFHVPAFMKRDGIKSCDERAF